MGLVSVVGLTATGCQSTTLSDRDERAVQAYIQGICNLAHYEDPDVRITSVKKLGDNNYQVEGSYTYFVQQNAFTSEKWSMDFSCVVKESRVSDYQSSNERRIS